MKDIFQEISGWIAGEEKFAFATVIKTWGSAPRQPGAAMAVTQDLRVAGSVSGGCIEGAVIEEAQKVWEDGKPRLLNFGVSDETAWSVGLSCGGKVEVWVEPHIAFSADKTEKRIWQTLEKVIRQNQPCILLTRLISEKHDHLLVFPDGSQIGDWAYLNAAANRRALENYARRETERVLIDGEPVFVQVFPRQDRLLIIGAGHISVPLVKFAKELDFELVVIDPRKIFAAAGRFPVSPDKLLHQWPQEALSQVDLNEETCAVLLTHDPKIDDPALHILLNSKVVYIGALGSRKTHQKRCERLRKAGFSEETIARIRGPVGLDIGAKNPTEIALSIIAEIVQVKGFNLKA
jgi:xanthine dehydrogenase accessory factor